MIKHLEKLDSILNKWQQKKTHVPLQWTDSQHLIIGSLSSEGKRKNVILTVFTWHSALSQSQINSARKDTKFIQIRTTEKKPLNYFASNILSLTDVTHKENPKIIHIEILKDWTKNLSQTVNEFHDVQETNSIVLLCASNGISKTKPRKLTDNKY